jgi:hypothetical protein
MQRGALRPRTRLALRAISASALVWAACEPVALSARASTAPDSVPAGAAPSTSFETSVWNPITVFGPAPRFNHALAYDTRRQRVVLFSGATQFSGGATPDTWEWDGTQWTDLSQPTSPTGQFGASFVYDPPEGYSLLASVDGTTWAWDGAAWTLLASAEEGPPARYFASLAFDGARNRVVLFGGCISDLCETEVPNDTWEWDGVSWTRMATTGPSARSSAAMVYDAKLQKVLLFGGASAGGILNDMWTWDGAAWTSLTPQGEVPSPRQQSAATYDDVRDVLLVFGGQQNSHALSDTWEWDGASWTRVSTAVTPGGRFSAPSNLIYDDALRKAVMLFGNNISGNTAYDDMWEYYTISLGGSCSTGAQCDSAAYCVQGVCCESTCSGACETCSASPGRCTLLARGASGSPICAPYVCTGSSSLCANSCVDDSDCSAGAYCEIDVGSCVPKLVAGTSCTSASSCASGACADSVCCDSACTGQCEACDLAGAMGTCSPVVGAPSGGRPACADAAGTGGCARTCDGKARDTCAGVQCGIGGPCAAPADCDAHLVCDPTLHVCTTPPAVCDGDHTIAQPGGGSLNCSPYRCTSAPACVTSCLSSADCVAGYRCREDGVCDASGTLADDVSGCMLGRGAAGDGGAVAVAAVGLVSSLRRRRRDGSRR